MSNLPELRQKEVLSRVDILMKNVLDRDTKETGTISRKGDYKNQIRVLYFQVLEELLIKEEKVHKQSADDILLNEDFHKALISCCIETTLFVNNYTHEDLTFMRLLELCNTQPFEFWRIITSFVRFDPHMPAPIQKHMHELELKIIFQLAWREDSHVCNLIKQLVEQNANAANEGGSNTTSTNEAMQEANKTTM